jgi:hypothetical protein
MDAALSVDANEDGELSAKEDLATVEVTTINGDFYSFPAMSKSALEMVLPKGSNRQSDAPLTLVNASTTILMIPLRICKTVFVDKELWWASPV